MARLTRPDPDRIGSYLSGYTKPEVVNKLGFLEHLGPGLVGEFCDQCRHLMETDEDQLAEICRDCPVTKLMELIQ